MLALLFQELLRLDLKQLFWAKERVQSYYFSGLQLLELLLES